MYETLPLESINDSKLQTYLSSLFSWRFYSLDLSFSFVSQLVIELQTKEIFDNVFINFDVFKDYTNNV